MLNQFFRLSFIFIFYICLAASCLAQPDTAGIFLVEHFTDANGLPQNSINDCIFDNDGYLWLGSQSGLIRFNGQAFKLFYPNDKPAMESNVISLSADSKGQIYFETDDHILYCYPGNNSHHLNAINSWNDHGAVLLSGSRQLFDFTHFLHPSHPVVRGRGRELTESDRRKQIYGFLHHRNDHFYPVGDRFTYLLYRDSLYYYNNEQLLPLLQAGSRTQPLILDGKCYVLKDDSVIAIYKDGKRSGPSRLIGGTPIRPGGQQAGPFRLFPSGDMAHLLAGNQLYRLYPAKDGTLTALYLADLGSMTNISMIAYDRTLDLLVVATGTDGFYSLRRNKFLQQAFSSSLRQRQSRYLFGPLALMDSSRIVTEQVIFDASGKYEWVKDSAQSSHKCLYIDRNKNIWGAVYDLPRMMNKHMEVTQVFPTVAAPVTDYIEDAKGDLYCLTRQSLWKKAVNDFQPVAGSEQLAAGSNCECLGLTPANRLLIGHSKGLTEFDPASGHSRAVPALDGAHVRSIYRCRDGSMLVGTYGQGYFYYHQGRFLQMPLDKNAFLMTAHCFLEDNSGNIWISCNKGLFRVPQADLNAWCEPRCSPVYYYHYDRQDGLLTNEFNGGFNAAGVITGNGFATLLSMKGLVSFQTDSLKAAFPTGTVSITNMEIDGASNGRYDSIVLSPDYKSLVLEVSCAFLGNRNNLYLEYRLSGLDSEWKEVPDDNLINCSRLSAGNYILQVRKVNGFGKNNYTVREWPITILPHFYQASWFRVLTALILLLLIMLLLQLWLKLLEKRKEIRVKAEKLKGTVVTLEDTVHRLQESEKALLKSSRQREKLISLVIHDLRSPLRFLTMLASDLHDNQGRLSAAEIKDRTYWVKKGAHDIYHFSEDFLLWVTSQKDDFSVEKHFFLVQPLLQEIRDFFHEQVLQKGNAIVNEVPKELRVYSDPHILLTIIRNLVDNANKYTEAGMIRIGAYKQEYDVFIYVTDSGKGMSAEQIDRFLQRDGSQEVYSGSQLGHKIIFDLTKRIDGSISIDSVPGIGTTVRLRLPRVE